VDLSGYLILPGIIDLHGDGFEHPLAPRPRAPFPMASGLAATDREAAGHGVTTAFLAQGWSWEGGRRGPDHAETLMKALPDYRPHWLSDLRIQVRAETHLVQDGPRLLAAIQRYGVTYVIFNNHLAEGLQMAPERSGRLCAVGPQGGILARGAARAVGAGAEQRKGGAPASVRSGRGF
jgi:alpha-D-ribose 1-methylphosphonate 5-triphosphate diphosphatase